MVEVRDTGPGIPPETLRAPLHPLLHHQAAGRGHRAGPVHLPAHRHRAGRRDHGGVAGGHRHRLSRRSCRPRRALSAQEDAAAARDRHQRAAGSGPAHRRRPHDRQRRPPHPAQRARRRHPHERPGGLRGDRGGRALRRHLLRHDDAGHDGDGVLRPAPAHAARSRPSASSFSRGAPSPCARASSSTASPTRGSRNPSTPAICGRS